MNTIPVIAFSAWSGTGKTTIIEKLIGALKLQGLRLAVIKHDAHDFDIDKEGKDSYRFTRAGADITVISSNKKTALIEERSLDLNEVLSLVHDVDLILLEGYNNEKLPRIGISRKETGKGFRHPSNEYIALVTDEEIQASIPVYALDDISGLCDFIISYIHIK